MMILYFSGVDHLIDRDDWIFAIRCLHNLVVDIVNDVCASTSEHIPFDVAITEDNNVTRIVYDLDLDIYDRVVMRSTSFGFFRVMVPDPDMVFNDIVNMESLYEDDGSEDDGDMMVDYGAHMLFKTFTHSEDMLDFHRHMELFTVDKERYYQEKSVVSQRFVDRILETFQNNSKNPAENLISDYLIFYLLPLIVHDAASNNMYIYDDAKGWILYNKNSLYTNISRDLRGLFLETDVLVDYYGSFNNRNRLLADVCIKLEALCTIDNINQKYLVGMANGVYNASTTVFHGFSPQSLVHLSTHVPLVIGNNADRLVSILLKIFPDPSILKMVIRWFGYLLEFGNPEKFLTIWHGASGNNGKSWVQRLIKESLGNYYHNIPTSLITSKRASSNAATPDLASLENKLVAFFQEPDTVEKIHSGRVKELTGNDTIYVRELYSQPKTIEVWAKLVIVANNRMETIGLDSALRRRFLVIPFESTFVTKAEYEARKHSNQSVANYYIREDIDHLCKPLAPVFVELAVEQHKMYKSEGITIPERIYRETTEFILANNRTLKFIRSHIIRSIGENANLQIVFEQFKAWHKQYYPAKQLLSMEVFLDELSKESIDIIDGSYLQDIFCNYIPTSNSYSV